MTSVNTFPGVCVCGTLVQVGQGETYQHGSLFRVRCATCSARSRLVGQPAGPPPTVKLGVRDGRVRYEVSVKSGWAYTALSDRLKALGAELDWVGQGSFSSTFESASQIVASLQRERYQLDVLPELPAAVYARIDATKNAVATTNKVLEELDAAMKSRGKFLRGYQKVGAAWLAARGPREGGVGALLSDDCGLGKTVTALAAVPPTAPCLVICPGGARGVWSKHFQEWRPEFKITIVKKPGEFHWPAPGEVVIVSYDTIRKCVLNGWPTEGTVSINDEVHRAKNPKSQQTEKVRATRVLIWEKNGCSWGLTATPILNRPDEFWEVGESIGVARESFRTFHDLVNAFGGRRRRGRPGYDWPEKVPAEAARRIQIVSLRREKKDVLKELPPKTHETIEVEIPKGVKKELDLVCKKALTSIEERGLTIDEALEKLVGSAGQGFEELAQAYKILALAKIPALLELVEDFEDAQEPLVVFSAHVGPVEALRARKGWGTIADMTTACYEADRVTKLREPVEAEELFQSGKLQNMAGTIAAMGTVYTLTRASNEIFVDLPWTPALLDQAEDRCIAEGQLVMTKDRGFVPVETVQAGEFVLSHLGNWRSVTGTSSRLAPCITTISYKRFGFGLELTPEHKVLACRGWKKPEWIQARDIGPGDFMVMPRPRQVVNVSDVVIPESMRVPRTFVNNWGVRQRNGRLKDISPVISLTDEALWVMGYFAADGFASVDHKKGAFVSFSGNIDSKASTLRRVTGYFKRSFGLEAKRVSRRSRGPLDRGDEIRVYCEDLARWFRASFGTHADNKRFPTELMSLPEDRSRHILDGYIAGDGHVRRRWSMGSEQFAWATTSSRLATQVCQLALKCGQAPCLRFQAMVGQWHGEWTERGAPDWKDLARFDHEFVYQPVTSSRTEWVRRRVFDLTVEHDHSFVVGQAAVHNCVRLGQTRGVVVRRLVFPHPLDQKKIELLDKKRAVIEGSVGASTVSPDAPIQIATGPLEKLYELISTRT